jgi:subtilisin-like proprotein convertase family protein
MKQLFSRKAIYNADQKVMPDLSTVLKGNSVANNSTCKGKVSRNYGFFYVAITVLFLLTSTIGIAANITSTATGGDWATGATWVGGVVPATGDNVTIATTGLNAVTTNANTIQCVNLTINSGATLTMYRPFLVTGTTSITGTINFGSTSGTSRLMTFTGSVTLNAGAVWNETSTGAIPTFSFGNSLVNNASTFTALSGSHTFTGATMTLSGSTNTSIPNVSITGTYTNNGTFSVGTAFTGSGTLVNGTNSILTVSGTATITTLTATATGNIVNYDGANQTIKATSYNNLSLSGTGIKTFGALATINANLSISGAATASLFAGSTSTAASLTLGGSGTASGSWGSFSSTATNQDNTYFAATTGILNASTNTCTNPTITTAATASSICFSAAAQTSPLTYSATTGSPNTYSITWNSSPANSFVTVNKAALPASQISIAVPAGTSAGTYTGTIIVQNAGGCASTGKTFTVTVNAPPTVSAGSAFTKTCTSNITGATIGEANDPNATYSWSPATGLSSATVSNPTANPATTTTYTVTKTNTASGCTATATVIVTVNAPTPSLSAGTAFIKTCISNITGAAIGEANDAAATYSWSPSTGLSSATVSNPTANPTATTTYTVTKTTTATGCSATATVIATVNNTSPTVSAGSPFTKTCTANTTGSTIGETSVAGNTYSWSPSTGLSSSTVGNPVANPTTTTTYTVTKTTTATGCTANASVLVTVVTTVPTVAAGTAFTKTCTSNASGATIGETNDATATYSWNNATSLSSAAVSNPTANPTATTTYTVTKTNIASGCTATASITATVNTTAPTVGAGTAFTKTCTSNTSGRTIGETAVAGNTYSWSPSAGLSSATVSNPTANPATTTTYTVTKTTTANGCTATGTVAVTVNNIVTVDAGTSFSITCTSNQTGAAIGEATVPGNTYSWSPSAGLSSSSISNPTANPTATTTYTVTKTNAANGCVATDVVTATVDNTAPVVAALTGTQTVCAGATTTYSSATSGGVWSSNNTAIATVAGGVVTGVASGTATISYTVTSANGCSTAVSSAITVNAVPAGAVTASSASICQGSTITFSAPVNIYDVYNFKINGNSVQNGVYNDYNTLGLNSGDLVTVEVFVNGCSAILTAAPVTVNALPATPTLTASATTICPGTNVVFTASTNAAYTAYNFKVNGSSVQNSNAGTYQSQTLNNNDIVTVEVSNINGCIKSSTPVTITVNVLPAGTLIASATVICTGSNVAFTATDGAQYQFKINGAIAQPYSPAATFNSTALTNPSVVSVDAKSAAGCIATYPVVLVTVNDLPTGTLTATENSGIANDKIICADDAVTFTASANTAYTNYNFIAGGVSKQSGAANTFTSTALANNDVVTVLVTTANGCSAIYSQSQQITVNALPAGTLSASATTICPGTNVTFTATADPSFTNYEFKIGGITVQNGNSNAYSNAALSDGAIVTVDVTNTNGCVKTFNPVLINVFAIPVGVLSATENSGTTSNDQTICAGATVNFSATSGYTNYKFLLNGITTLQNGGTNTCSTSTLSDADVVTVEVTNASGCKITFAGTPFVVTPLPVIAAITGSNNVCVNSTTQLSNAANNGVWLSSNPAVATVSSTGMVTGLSSGTTTISYTVTNTNNCSGKNVLLFTVNDLPVVAATSGPTAVCVGNTITLANTTTIAAPTTGAWTSSDITIATVSSSHKVTGVSAGVATIVYTVTNGFTCSRANTYTVTINALPVLAKITGDTVLCANGTTTLHNNTPGGVWTSNSKPIATIDPSTGVVTGVAAGTTTINYTYTNANGCISTVSQIITVNPVPVPTLTGKNPICLNDVEIYTTQTGQTNYTWTVVGGTKTIGTGGAGNNDVEVTWTSAGTKTINVNYTNSFGCMASTSSSFTNAPTALPPTFTGGVSSVCLNSSGNVYATQTGKTDYTWTVDGGTITAGDLTNSITVTWNTSGAKSVSVNYSDIGGCNAANATAYPVTVNPLPTATISSSAAAACQNGTAPTVTFTGAGGLANYTFTYKISTNGVYGGLQTVVSSGNSATVPVSTIAPGSTYIYTLVSVQDGKSCAQAQTGSVTVYINPLPTVSITNPAAVCSPSTVDLTLAGVTTGSTAGLLYTYWTNSGASSALPAPASVAAGTYYIKGTSAAGCATIKPVVVTVNTTPTVVINTPASVCSPGTVNLAAAAVTTGSTASLTYTYWSDALATSNYAAYATAAAGTYYIKGTTALGCYQIQPVTVTVNTTPTVVITTPAAVCSPATVNLTATAVTSGSTGGLVYTYYTDAAGTAVYANAATAIAATYYIKGTTAAGCFNVKAVTVTVNPTPTVVIVTPAAVCSPATVNLTASAITNGSTAGLTYTYYTDAAATNVLASASTVSTSGTYYIKGATASGCYDIKPVTVTINASPIVVIANPAAVCSPATADITNAAITAGSTAGLTFTYWTNAGATTAYANAATAVAGTYYIKGTTAPGCAVIQPVTVTVNALPSVPTVTPSIASICQFGIQPLSAGTSPLASTQTFSSGTINLGIPDNSSNGIASMIAVSGIPAGAVINSVNVNFNISHAKTGELRINLKAPNGSILNLVDREGGSNANFTNTVITSVTPTTSIVGKSAPFTSTYSPEAGNNISAGSAIGGNSTTNLFTDLFATPNGNWVFGVRDGSNGTVGSITNWSVTINYTVVGGPQNATWSPISDLYTDAAATTAYTGQSITTVYTKPATSGSKLYTATVSNAAGCTNATNSTITVSSVPVVSVVADYCTVPGKVRLTASSVPSGATFAWSNGMTGSMIDVDVADVYDVIATMPVSFCTGSASVSVAQELVTNGDFTNGNTGFTSDYTYYADVAGNNELVPDNGTNGYGVGTDGQNYHSGFWGLDHTNNPTGNRNFMLVNGHGTLTAWKTTVDVLPNTTYYFSAWGISLNNAAPFARLQFNVNGVQVGTVATLAAGVNSNSNNGWTRFYGTWTSGTATTNALISIKDLENAAGGNDFGIDDISFGTLSTFVTLANSSGSDAQTVCTNTAILPIVYNVGSSSAPTVTGLPAGVISTFNGVTLTINGTPTIAGNYAYSVTTTGSCNPTTATGTINVQAQILNLTTGINTQTVCKGTAISNVVYTAAGTATTLAVSAGSLPSGVTAAIAGKVLTISGTPTVAGTFNYTITTTGTCAPVSVNGTIIVNEQTIALSSGSTTQSVCVNNSISTIAYTIGGTGTGATVANLPNGITGTYNSGLFLISGTPTVNGTFTYTVTTTGTCNSTSMSGTITVNPNATIALTAAGANNQTICSNSAIANITYAIAGGGTGASATGLPAGITGNYAAGIFTISGTPTAGAGTYNYTITTSGTCTQATATGTITLQSQSMTLSSGSTTQTICNNTAITDIKYTIGGTATDVIISAGALPAGVTGKLTGKIYTISGTPSQGGVFTYTITSTGTCSPAVSASGSITVQVPAISLTAGSTNQTLCLGSPVTPVVYKIGGTATSASMTAGTLPTGITGVFNAGTGLFTISGTPTQSGLFSYTITTSGSCGAVSISGTLSAGSNTWTGAVSSNWSDANNWSCGAVPGASTDVIIAVSAAKMPVLTGMAICKSLELQTNTTLNLNGQAFSTTGTITGMGKFIGSKLSGLTINGSNIISTLYFDQTIDDSTNALNNLTISSAGSTITLDAKMNIHGAVTPTAGLLILNDTLVLNSDENGTARVGAVTGAIDYTGNGKVTVERFYPMSRSWRLVTSPLSNTGSIYNSWQEGAPANYVPGKGMFITGPNPGITTGLDVSAFNNYSMKGWDAAGNKYLNIGNTKNQLLSNPAGQPGIASNIGFYAFVRGDRRRTPDNTVFGNMNNTTLRSTGKLQTGNQTFNITSGAGTYPLIGNPYASAVDFNKISKTNIVPYRFYVYDPSLGTVGVFVTMEDMDGDGIFTSDGQPTTKQGNFIQSSQAFFVQVMGTGNSSVTFKESDKVANNTAGLFRPTRPAAEMESFRITLYQTNANNNTLLADGTLVQFDDAFSDKVDMDDALKFTNISENLSILRYNQYLAVERRPLIKATDTIFLQLSKTTQRGYRFTIEPTNLPATLTAFLQDSYTGLNTPINVLNSSDFDFAINADARSSAANRFRIVFKQADLGPLPVTFKSINASPKAGNIEVSWTVENELNIKNYEVEKSADGVIFKKVNTTAAKGTNRISTTYNWMDENAVSGNNYYRVRSIGADGKYDYTSVVLVKMGKVAAGGIRIYPNPVTDGIIGAEFKNVAAGIYTIRLLNSQGQTILNKSVNHAPGTSMEYIQPLYKMLSGIYQLEITSPEKEINQLKVIVK